MVGMDSKRKRYQEEIKRIRQLSAINKVLKKGDVENAFLNNADKETEISKDTAVERMLEELQADKSERKDLELLESLVNEETGSAPRRRQGLGIEEGKAAEAGDAQEASGGQIKEASKKEAIILKS